MPRVNAVPSPFDVGHPARRAIEALASKVSSGETLSDGAIPASKLLQTVAWCRRTVGAGQVVANVTNTTVTFNATSWNLGSSMLNVGTYPNSLVAPVSGFYSFTYFVVFSAATGNFTVATWLETSRSLVRYGDTYANSHNPSAGFEGSERIYLNAGDRVSLRCYHERGTAYNIAAARLTGSLDREVTVAGAP